MAGDKLDHPNHAPKGGEHRNDPARPSVYKVPFPKSVYDSYKRSLDDAVAGDKKPATRK